MASEELGLSIAIKGFAKFVKDMGMADKAVHGLGKSWVGLKKFSSGAVRVLKKAGKIALVGIAAGATAAAAAVGGLAVAIGKMTLEAAPIAGVQRAFEGLTEEFEGGSKAMLAALKESSSGMIANRDLMMSYNKTVQLVGKNFGEQLPDAMQYLSKVAAATGEDMGYMMDSLVRGVGRLSPMILDNLGIQVDLVEANEAYALSINKSVDALDKGEQQTALMNQVMEKLAENTAAMPEVTGTAAASMAELKATFQDTKDAIGMAFLPALAELLVPIKEIADEAGPRLIEWAQSVGTWLGENLPRVIEVFKKLLKGDLGGAVGYVAAIISSTFGRDKAVEFYQFFEDAKEKVGPFIERITGTFQAIVEWVQMNWPIFRDTVLSVVEQIREWFITNWPIIQAVALTAWEVIRDVVMSVVDVIINDVWPNLQAAFQNIQDALDVFGLQWKDIFAFIGVVISAVVLGAIAIFSGLVSAISAGIAHMTKVLKDIAKTFYNVFEAIAQIVGGAMAIVTGIIEGDIDKVWEGIKAFFSGVFNLVKSFFEGVINFFNLSFGTLIAMVSEFIEGVIDFFTNLYNRLVGESLIPEMMYAMWEAIKDGFAKIVESVKKWIADIIEKVKSFVKDFVEVGKDLIAGMAKGIREAVKDLIRKVGDWIQDIIDEALRRIGARSPSEVFRDIGHKMMEGLELGIEDMLSDVHAQMELAVTPVMGAASGGDTYSTVNNYNLSTTSTTSEGTLAMEFADMAMATR